MAYFEELPNIAHTSLLPNRNKIEDREPGGALGGEIK